jgi:excisionase family DNA binding protein
MPSRISQERDVAVRLTPKQAAERAGVSPNLIYLWCKEGRLAHYHLGSEGTRGRILIDPADLDRLMEEYRQERHPLLAE